MANIWEVKEGVRYVLPTEKKAFKITTTAVGSSPTSVAVVAYDESVDAVVTDTVYPTNTTSVSSDDITLSLFRGDLATAGHKYRVEVTFTDSDSNIWTRVFKVTVPKL